MARPLPLLTLLVTAACASRGAAPAPAAPAAPTPAREPAAAGDPATLRFATGPSRYRVEGATHTEQEVMGSSTTFDLTTMLLVSTVMSEAAGNLTLAITVDSVTVTGTVPGADPALFDSARGRSFQAVFTGAGRPVSVSTPDSANPIFANLARGFREFVPVLPPGRITPGAAWSDTVTQTVPNPGGSGTTNVTSRRQHRVVGWETRDGVRALHLTMTSAITLSGSGEIQGQPIELTGTGTSTAERWVSAAGVYLGASQADTTNIMVNVLAMGLQVPVRQTQRTTVTRLP
jgi:hypothetical protein